MKVILISGKAGHGKDTFARMFREIAEEKGDRVLVTHYADLLKFICKSFFGWNGEKDEAGRSLLQYVGTDVVRASEPDFWVGFLVKILSFFKDEWDWVLIPDARFPNEVSVMQEAFDSIHVGVVRTGWENGLTEEQKSHPSETAMDDVAPELTLINETGMPSVLQAGAQILYAILRTPGAEAKPEREEAAV